MMPEKVCLLASDEKSGAQDVQEDFQGFSERLRGTPLGDIWGSLKLDETRTFPGCGEKVSSLPNFREFNTYFNEDSLYSQSLLSVNRLSIQCSQPSARASRSPFSTPRSIREEDLPRDVLLLPSSRQVSIVSEASTGASTPSPDATWVPSIGLKRFVGDEDRYWSPKLGSGSKARSHIQFDFTKYRHCLTCLRYQMDLLPISGSMFKDSPEEHPMWILGGLLHWMWASRRLFNNRCPFGRLEPNTFWGYYCRLCTWITIVAGLNSSSIEWDIYFNQNECTSSKDFDNERDTSTRMCSKVPSGSPTGSFNVSRLPDLLSFEHTAPTAHQCPLGTKPRGVTASSAQFRCFEELMKFKEAQERWQEYYREMMRLSSPSVTSTKTSVERSKQLIKNLAHDALVATNNAALKAFGKEFNNMPLLERDFALGLFRSMELGINVSGFGDLHIRSSCIWGVANLPNKILHDEESLLVAGKEDLLRLRLNGFLVTEAKLLLTIVRIGRSPQWWYRWMLALREYSIPEGLVLF